jgi:uroporphyrinogen decarboxylase
MDLKMTSKQRMLTAFRNEQPDMVPVSPDISNMVPCRLTGKPFWDIYLYNDPPLWVAYINAVKYYGFDGWSDKGFLGSRESAYGRSPEYRETEIPKFQHKIEVIEKTRRYIIVRDVFETPRGVLWSETVYYRDNPPWTKRKLVKNPERDFDILFEYILPDPANLPGDAYWEIANAMGDLGITGLGVPLPGLHDLFYYVDGGYSNVIKLYYTMKDLIEEYRRRMHEWVVAYTEKGLRIQPEFILIGASGLLTMQSPRIFRELSLPTLKKITEMCREADIISHLHACGREHYIVEVAANETDLYSIEPLEEPPNGDCNLADIKRRFGRRLALKGNIQTSWLLMAKPEEVEEKAKWCIDVAGENGGYVLSTGDQVGRDTPDENIFAMIRAARNHGKYPLKKFSIQK